MSISPKDGVVEGKMAVLTCESDANPAPSHYNWFDGNNQDLHHYGQTLRLEPVKLQHSGSYWCRGANRLGQSQSPPTTLTVYCKGPCLLLGPWPLLGLPPWLCCCVFRPHPCPGPAHPPSPAGPPCSTHSSSIFLFLLSLCRLQNDCLSACPPPSRHPERLLAPSFFPSLSVSPLIGCLFLSFDFCLLSSLKSFTVGWVCLLAEVFWSCTIGF